MENLYKCTQKQVLKRTYKSTIIWIWLSLGNEVLSFWKIQEGDTNKDFTIHMIKIQSVTQNPGYIYF